MSFEELLLLLLVLAIGLGANMRLVVLIPIMLWLGACICLHIPPKEKPVEWTIVPQPPEDWQLEIPEGPPPPKPEEPKAPDKLKTSEGIWT